MKYAIFNRLRDEFAKDDEPYIYEFEEPLEFFITEEDEPKLYSSKYDIKFDDIITPPQRFHDKVLEAIKEKVKNGEITDVKLLKRNEVE